MALFTYIFEKDQIEWRNVSDSEVKEAFDEALTFDKSLMISVYRYKRKKGLFGSEIVDHFTVYHEIFLRNGESAMEARQQMSASGSKEKCIAYLHGIINGAKALLRNI